MAKDKTSSGPKTGSSKGKVPKTVAGVKVPKTLRDTGKAAMKLAQSPVARELLSAGLAAAAAAVASNTRTRKAVAQSGKETADALAGAATGAADNAGKLGAALVGAAGNAAERFLSGGTQAAKAATSAPRKPAKKAAAPKAKAAPKKKAAAAKSEPAAEKKSKSGKAAKSPKAGKGKESKGSAQG